MKLQNVFRRVSQAGRSQEEDQQQQQQLRKEPTGQLFGRNLAELSASGEEGAVSLPFPVVVSSFPAFYS
jgi:transcription initiation factor TFIID subunit TAF12